MKNSKKNILWLVVTMVIWIGVFGSSIYYILSKYTLPEILDALNCIKQIMLIIVISAFAIVVMAGVSYIRKKKLNIKRKLMDAGKEIELPDNLDISILKEEKVIKIDTDLDNSEMVVSVAEVLK